MQAFGHMRHAAFGVVPPFNPNGMVKLFPKGAELPFRFIRLFQRKMFHGDDRILARAVDQRHVMGLVIDQEGFRVETAAEMLQD